MNHVSCYQTLQTYALPFKEPAPGCTSIIHLQECFQPLTFPLWTDTDNILSPFSAFALYHDQKKIKTFIVSAYSKGGNLSTGIFIFPILSCMRQGHEFHFSNADVIQCCLRKSGLRRQRNFYLMVSLWLSTSVLYKNNTSHPSKSMNCPR